jgi:ferric-dicitrate binding protein FerR (iron transport regulator)
LEVKVLGTHFNINSYKEEITSNTTLIEGSVSLSKGDANVILKSGDQAQVGNSDKITVIDNVDVHNVLAWKNGYFSFDKSDLKLILRQISRWYDVDISFEGESPKRVFSGKINRNSNISDVLKILNECKVNFRIEGRKLIVMG